MLLVGPVPNRQDEATAKSKAQKKIEAAAKHKEDDKDFAMKEMTLLKKTWPSFCSDIIVLLSLRSHRFFFQEKTVAKLSNKKPIQTSKKQIQGPAATNLTFKKPGWQWSSEAATAGRGRAELSEGAQRHLGTLQAQVCDLAQGGWNVVVVSQRNTFLGLMFCFIFLIFFDFFKTCFFSFFFFFFGCISKNKNLVWSSFHQPPEISAELLRSLKLWSWVWLSIWIWPCATWSWNDLWLHFVPMWMFSDVTLFYHRLIDIRLYFNI